MIGEEEVDGGQILEGGGFGGDKEVEEDKEIGRGGDRDRLGRGRRQGDVPIVVEGAEW